VLAEAELEVTAELSADEVPDDVVGEATVEVKPEEDVEVVEDVLELVGLEVVVEEPADVDDVVADEDIEVVEDVVRLVRVEDVVEDSVDVDEVAVLAEEEVVDAVEMVDAVETAVSGRAPRSNARRRGWATGVWTVVPREK